MNPRLTIIGAGLAGSEAAWQAAELGVSVDLYEMRPEQPTAAHRTAGFAELVCSNSFGSDSPHTASRILKDELAALGAFVLAHARQNAVAAGASLAVDRDRFSESITRALEAHPRITIHRQQAERVPEGVTIVATGPLTSPALSADLAARIGGQSLYFYDAISPIVAADSLDLGQMFFANRYDKGDTADFLNIPLTREQYNTLVTDLLTGEVMLPHEFEEERYFESCMPIEALAARGPRTLAFGPMKPVGLTDPKTGRWAHAVVQLRTENAYRSAYNLVGFQTKLKYPEQQRIFRKLPGLQNAEFLRLGSMHRNTYIDSPRVLLPTLQLRRDPRLLIAGQLTGTEGYLESSATGWLAGQNAARIVRGESPLCLPVETMLGGLLAAITDPAREHFQPMNSNMGILPPLAERPRDRAARNEAMSLRARGALRSWLGETSTSA
jgi:methylenetetrahydrofolate--tRNA-(uracil-5-)-methyltransferase